MKKLALADGHGLFRTAIRNLLESTGEYQVVAEAASGQEAVRAALDTRPDIVLMNVVLPGISGAEATRQITQQLPETRVLIVSENDRPNFVQTALKEGACGYLLKTASADELRVALNAVEEGKCYLSPDIAECVVGQLGGRSGERRPNADLLTHREREVLQLVAEGLSSKEIASHLCISMRTVDAHRASLMDKTGTSKAAGLVRWAIREGLVAP